jgi:hypothetical protein
MRKFTAVAVLALMFAAASASGAIIDDFDGYADQAAFDAQYSAGQHDGLDLSSGSGIGGGNAIDTDDWHNSITTNPTGSKHQTFDLSNVGAKATFSYFVNAQVAYYDNAEGPASDRGHRLGFVADGPNHSFNTDGLMLGLGLTGFSGTDGDDEGDAIDQDSEVDALKWQFGWLADGDDSYFGSSFEVTDGWYKVTAEFEILSATEIEVSGDIDFYGANGLSFDSDVYSDSTVADIDDATFLGSTAAMFIKGSEKDRTGIDGVDNINVTPEPATMSLLALGGLGVLIRRKRS